MGKILLDLAPFETPGINFETAAAFVQCGGWTFFALGGGVVDAHCCGEEAGAITAKEYAQEICRA